MPKGTTNSDALYSVRLKPQKHQATTALIDILERKNILKKGPTGIVSRWALLEYLIDCGLVAYSDEIFPDDENEEIKDENVNQNGN